MASIDVAGAEHVPKDKCERVEWRVDKKCFLDAYGEHRRDQDSGCDFVEDL